MYYSTQVCMLWGQKDDDVGQNIGYPTTLEFILFFSGLVSVVVFRMVVQESYV